MNHYDALSSGDRERIVELLGHLNHAWNAGDGTTFAAHFASDADYVNIMGQHARGRTSIAEKHQHMFDFIYKGSVCHYALEDARSISPGFVVAHIGAHLSVPVGPSTGNIKTVALGVFKKSDDRFLILSLQNTRIAEGGL